MQQNYLQKSSEKQQQQQQLNLEQDGEDDFISPPEETIELQEFNQSYEQVKKQMKQNKQNSKLQYFKFDIFQQQTGLVMKGQTPKAFILEKSKYLYIIDQQDQQLKLDLVTNLSIDKGMIIDEKGDTKNGHYSFSIKNYQYQIGANKIQTQKNEQIFTHESRKIVQSWLKAFEDIKSRTTNQQSYVQYQMYQDVDEYNDFEDNAKPIDQLHINSKEIFEDRAIKKNIIYKLKSSVYFYRQVCNFSFVLFEIRFKDEKVVELFKNMDMQDKRNQLFPKNAYLNKIKDNEGIVIQFGYILDTDQEFKTQNELLALIQELSFSFLNNFVGDKKEIQKIMNKEKLGQLCESNQFVESIDIVRANNGRQADKLMEIQALEAEKIIVENIHIFNCLNNYHSNRLTYGQKQKFVIGKSSYSNQEFWYQADFSLIKDSVGKNNGYKYTNTQVIEAQRSCTGNLFGKVGRTIMSGTPLWKINLPAQLYEARSVMERAARTFGHVDFLRNAGRASENVIEAIKYLTCFYQSSFVLALTQQMQLNGILGETFQGRIDGDPIYFEQVSTHPPVSYYYMNGDNYKLYGPHSPMIYTQLMQGLSSGQQHGHPILELPNGIKLYYIWFGIKMKGVLMGDRIFYATGKSYCFEPYSRIVCELLYDTEAQNNQSFYYDFSDEQSSYPNKKGTYMETFPPQHDAIVGGIYKVTEDCIKKLQEFHKLHSKAQQQALKIDLISDVQEVYCKAQGKYSSFLAFNNIKYWDINRHAPYMVEYVENCLPSDSRFRMDGLSVRQGDIDKADDKRELLDRLDKEDRKVREKFAKKR